MCDEVGKPCSSSTTGRVRRSRLAIEDLDAVDRLGAVVRDGCGAGCRLLTALRRMRRAATRRRRPVTGKPQEEPAAIDCKRVVDNLSGFHVDPPCRNRVSEFALRARSNTLVDQPGEEAGIDDEVAELGIEGRGRLGRDRLVARSSLLLERGDVVADRRPACRGIP